MAQPDPQELFEPEVWARIIRLAALGRVDEIRQEVDRDETANQLRVLLAVGLGLSVFELTQEEIVGKSFGLTVYQRARKTSAIIADNLIIQTRRILADRRRVLDRPNGGRFQIGGFSSRQSFRDKYRKLIDEGQLAAAQKLLGQEVADLAGKAAARNIGKRSEFYAWRFLDTEYRRVGNLRRQKRIVASPKFAFEIVIPQPGFCTICAPFVLKVAPKGSTTPPTYHPNCRCKIYPWDPEKGIISDF